MANLIIQENGAARTMPAVHGEEITIQAPCDCSAVTGVQIAGVAYPFYDAAGNALASGSGLFAEGSLIRVLIDAINIRATIINHAAATAKHAAQHKTGGSDPLTAADVDALPSGGTAVAATKLATARTIDGVDFNGTAAITHYGTCGTAAATTAKTVALTGFKLVTGAKVAVKFTVTNTGAVGSLTLNVNSTGAKNIKYRNGNLPSAGTLAANRVYEFVYDGTYWQLIGDLDTNTTYTHPASGVTAGTYRSVTVDVNGHVTAGSNPTVSVGQGGTGKTSFTANRLIYPSASTTLTQLAFPSAAAALCQGTSGAPYWKLLTDFASAKVEVKSYTGTGTCGPSNPTSVTFSFAPKFVWMVAWYEPNNSEAKFRQTHSPSTSGGHYRSIIVTDALSTSYDETITGHGFLNNDSSSGSLLWSFAKKSTDGKTISWYLRNKDTAYPNSGVNANGQFNGTGFTYYVLGIG